jgi:hypothetical protein
MKRLKKVQGLLPRMEKTSNFIFARIESETGCNDDSLGHLGEFNRQRMDPYLCFFSNKFGFIPETVFSYNINIKLSC